jgi:hypothetical protein
MSFGLTHTGAIARGPAYAPVVRVRPAQTDQTPNVSAVKAVRPAAGAAEARERIREQVMAERGVDLLDLYRMGSYERIRAESEIAAETAERARQAQARGVGTLVDVRV